MIHTMKILFQMANMQYFCEKILGMFYAKEERNIE